MKTLKDTHRDYLIQYVKENKLFYEKDSRNYVKLGFCSISGKNSIGFQIEGQNCLFYSIEPGLLELYEEIIGIEYFTYIYELPFPEFNSEKYRSRKGN